MNFEDLGLSAKTVQAIKELGIDQPTTVQADVIPSILAGKDVFTIAPERCGKTCSYVFPLIDVISRHEGLNILIITADSAQAVTVSDRLAVFNKYHEETENEQEDNVVIASPDLLLDIAAEGKIDLSAIQILVVDDINLIKKKRQLGHLKKVLEKLPTEKQNIVFTTRRSRETQEILDKILKTPAEIKVDRCKEDEASQSRVESEAAKGNRQPRTASAVNRRESQPDREAVDLAEKFQTFGKKTPAFLLIKGNLAKDEK
jgi:superfamily II DNA/RNA helicase